MTSMTTTARETARLNTLDALRTALFSAERFDGAVHAMISEMIGTVEGMAPTPPAPALVPILTTCALPSVGERINLRMPSGVVKPVTVSALDTDGSFTVTHHAADDGRKTATSRGTVDRIVTGPVAPLPDTLPAVAAVASIVAPPAVSADPAPITHAAPTVDATGKDVPAPAARPIVNDIREMDAAFLIMLAAAAGRMTRKDVYGASKGRSLSAKREMLNRLIGTGNIKPVGRSGIALIVHDHPASPAPTVDPINPPAADPAPVKVSKPRKVKSAAAPATPVQAASNADAASILAALDTLAVAGNGLDVKGRGKVGKLVDQLAALLAPLVVPTAK